MGKALYGRGVEKLKMRVYHGGNDEKNQDGNLR